MRGDGTLSRRGGRRRAAGFTLIELLTTLTVLGLLLAVAVPSFNNAILGNKLSGFSNSFLASAQLARSEAIKRNAAMTMCRSADGTNCASSGGWQQGWIIFNDKDGNGAVGSDETRVHYQQALGSDFSFTGDAYTVVFQSTGLSATSGTLTLCRKLPSPGSQERVLSLSATGRVSSAITRTGTCA
ncbi:GspH/FimT family protein [Ramlibacter sp. XY19]|uniref:GspH/FimT family protein n=1 Tax=Ramlibacter paludis TaxID=2908000 RepID=UPI0023DC453A|nr:GspH/FimT family protein [Ramlibacter paludis]MCG2592854.1 GspH/FimT family protein [Ramlibacter paludis]